MPSCDGLDEAAEQRRAGEPGGSGGAVERDDARERAAVAAGEDARLGAQLAAVGDGRSSLTRPLLA